MNPHIYVLILNWNGKDVLKSCLDSIVAIDYPNYTTLVIDNDSSDRSGEMVKNDYTEIEYLQLRQNYGCSGGYNRCFDYLRDKNPEYILLLDNDTEVEPDILNSFIEAVEYYGSQNIFGGKIFYHHDPQKIWYAGGKIKLKYGKISHFGIRKMDSEEYSFPQKTDYIPGCCLFTAWDIMEKVNGFDEQFFTYGNDVDLCLRARKAGFYCYFWPDAKLRHHVSASIGGRYSFKKIINKLISYQKIMLKHLFY